MGADPAVRRRRADHGDLFVQGILRWIAEELFESARLDGAGHLRLYWHIVLPLSKQIIAVVAIINALGTWNNFLWPFITNADDAITSSPRACSTWPSPK